MDVELSARARTIVEKVDRVRRILDDKALFGTDLGTFPRGAELDEVGILAGYRVQMEGLFEEGLVREEVLATLDMLTLPTAMIELYRITDGSRPVDHISLFDTSSPMFGRKGEIRDPEGENYRFDEHWLMVGLHSNDKFLVSLTSGEVMFADQYYWRYDEADSSRVLAPDMLTFFDEFVIGPRCREFLSEEDINDPDGWYQLLRTSGFI